MTRESSDRRESPAEEGKVSWFRTATAGRVFGVLGGVCVFLYLGGHQLICSAIGSTSDSMRVSVAKCIPQCVDNSPCQHFGDIDLRCVEVCAEWDSGAEGLFSDRLRAILTEIWADECLPHEKSDQDY